MEQIPFYMTFPMQNLYVMELEYEKDIERMKSLYPTEVADIQAAIEERCDELEYEGGRIFDEEPDRYMIHQEIMRLYDMISKKKESGDAFAKPMEQPKENKKSYFANYFGSNLDSDSDSDFDRNLIAQNHRRRGGHGECECDNWLCSMIGIMFTNEIYRRRCRHRRCNRWW